METCPCCLRPALPGLFDKLPESDFPEPMLFSEKEERESFLGNHFGARKVFGRFFLQADLPLPLRRSDTPITLCVWIEVLDDAAMGIKAVLDEDRRSFSGRATLATDVPGFPGSAGATCRIRFRGERVQILDCSDSRIGSLPADMDHDQMAALYRLIWGNSEKLQPVRWDLREEALQHLRGQLQRRHHNKLVEPPPRLAGMDPGEVLVAPPVDTGEPAFLATLGCADVPDGSGQSYEVLAALQNPSEDLVRCFGEFAYLARMNPEANLLGQIVPERRPIPDSDGKMIAWLLIPADEDWIRGKGDVQYLQAIPLMPVEVSFANVFGPEKLWEVLQGSGEDITSLRRGPSVEAIE